MSGKGPLDVELTRRVFVHRLTFLGGGVVLLGGACKREGTPPPPKGAPQALTTSHRTFTSEEFATLSAACERVLPKDEDAGALDANVPEYIDRALTAPELSQMKDQFLGGIAALERRAKRAHQKPFAALTPEQQDQLLTDFKDSREGTGEARFFELLVVLTLEGFLGDPSYGGNKDHAGWKLVGFQTSEPPPGYDGLKHLGCHHGG
jgi:gluconate 2-dehydrogenase gamma chain